MRNKNESNRAIWTVVCVLCIELYGLFACADLALSAQDVSALALSQTMTEEHRSIVVEVDTTIPSDARTLEQMGWDVVSENAISPIQMLVSSGQLELLKQSGWNPRIVLDDLDRHFREKVNADGNLDGYHTYAEMLAEMQETAALYPDIAKLVDIGDSWEKVHNEGGHDIWAMKIATQPDIEDTTKPDILIMGNHHARELISTEIPLAIINALKPSTEQIRRSKTSLKPMKYGCPDTETRMSMTLEQGNNWRKNRNRTAPAAIAKQGVDINRNYGYSLGL